MARTFSRIVLSLALFLTCENLCAQAVGRVAARPAPTEAPLSAEKLASLDGEALLAATKEMSFALPNSKRSFTTDQLITIADKLKGTVKTLRAKVSPNDDMNPFSTFFEEACAHADDKHVDRLIDIYSGLDPSSFEKTNVLPVLAALCVEREVHAIAKEQPKVSLKESPGRVPSEQASLPPELIAAWRSYQGANVAYEKAFPKVSSEDKIDGYGNAKSFYSLVTQSLREGSPGVENEVSRYADTGVNCLNVTDIDDARDIAVMMSLLKERKLAEAIGATLKVVGTTGSTSDPEKLFAPTLEFLKSCHLDWESIMAGAYVSKVTDMSYILNAPCLTAMAKYGGDRSASLLNALARWDKPESHGIYGQLLGSFIETTPTLGKCDSETVESTILTGPSSVTRDDQAPISKSLQAESLAVLESYATSGCSKDIAETLLPTFARTQSRSSLAALHQLLLHDSDEVANSAARILCAMGERTGPRRNTAPVVFQILCNGMPLVPGSQVGWLVHLRNGDTTSSQADVSKGGVVNVDRSYFTSRINHATQISFSSYGDNTKTPIFKVTMPTPGNLDAITRVDVKLSPLVLKLSNLAELNLPRLCQTKMFLQPHDNGLPDLISELGHRFELPVGDSITLPSVQEGTYDVELLLAGAEVWRGSVKAGSGEPPSQIFLKPGSDVRYKIIDPHGDELPGRFLKDGKPLDRSPDRETGTYQSLPCGNYLLHVDDGSVASLGAGRAAPGPDEVRFLPRDISFRIEKGSPALIDLGEIKLEAASR